MPSRPIDALTPDLVKKGEARGLSPDSIVLSPPTTAHSGTPVAPLNATAMPKVPPPPDIAVSHLASDTPALTPVPPADVARRFISFRVPVELDEDLRAMIFQTRRSKQDLLIEFVSEGVKKWKRDLAKSR
jgi:hypothetical protein